MKPITSLVISFLFSALAHAGDGRGNGGGVVVCDDGSVELLDLWEGEALEEMQFAHSSSEPLAQALAVVPRLAKFGRAGMITGVTEIVRRLNEHAESAGDWFLPKGVAIAAPADAKNRFIKRDCHLEGVALYDDDHDRLDIDETLYRRLTSQQRAALLVHEAVFKYLRAHSDVTDSIVARHYTACLFSGDACEELDPVAGIPTTGLRFECLDYNIHFLIFPIHSGQGADATEWRIQKLDVPGLDRVSPTRLYDDFTMVHPSLHGGQLRVESIGSTGRDIPLRLHASEDRWRDVYQTPLVLGTNNGGGSGSLELNYTTPILHCN